MQLQWYQAKISTVWDLKLYFLHKSVGLFCLIVWVCECWCQIIWVSIPLNQTPIQLYDILKMIISEKNELFQQTERAKEWHWLFSGVILRNYAATRIRKNVPSIFFPHFFAFARCLGDNFSSYNRRKIWFCGKKWGIEPSWTVKNIRPWGLQLSNSATWSPELFLPSDYLSKY